MGRTRDGTIALRAQVLALKGQNLSNYAIGRTIGRSEKFVRDAVKRFNELNSFESRKKAVGLQYRRRELIERLGELY